MNDYIKMCVEKNADFCIYYGKGKYRSTYEQMLHYDTNYTISYFLCCSGNIKISGNQYNLTSGNVVIMNPKEIHKCEIVENSYHERVSVCINKSFFNEFCSSCKELYDFFENRKEGAGNVIPSDVSDNFGLHSLFEQILTLAQNKSTKNKVLLNCKITELLYQLSDVLPRTNLSPVFCVDENPVISETIKYIDGHFSEDINCSEIAKKVSVSKFHLDHMFKEFVGISLWEYVVLKRLLFVNQNIQRGVSVNEASYLAGFHNYSNFYRLYKKHFNITPAEYKSTFKYKNVTNMCEIVEKP